MSQLKEKCKSCGKNIGAGKNCKECNKHRVYSFYERNPNVRGLQQLNKLLKKQGESLADLSTYEKFLSFKEDYRIENGTEYSGPGRSFSHWRDNFFLKSS